MNVIVICLRFGDKGLAMLHYSLHAQTAEECVVVGTNGRIK
jgi:hypothetical protein